MSAKLARIAVIVLMCIGLGSCASPSVPQQTVRETATVGRGAAITQVAVWDLDNLSSSKTVQPDLGQAFSGRIIEAFESK
ncbi:MAG: hypothetical protein Q7J25_13000, partial [Vicinamibacterales bacterium]|nr:hypothetical protein [Vicinamibacterales bacterium]